MFQLSDHILFEDNHLLVVNKPAGLPVQKDASGDRCLTDYAEEYLRIRYEKPGRVYLGLVHRLDRPVSGVIVVARTSKAAERLSRQFADHQNEKIYLAWVDGIVPPAFDLENYLLRDGKRCIVGREEEGGKFARLHAQRIEIRGSLSLVRIRLETGRHHQIRCQFAHAGFPVAGDGFYGSQIRFRKGKIALHAYILRLEHPVKKETLELTVPPDWSGNYAVSVTE